MKKHEQHKKGERTLKIALGTVLYPGAEKFMLDFAECINMQLDKDFDVLAVNDGMGEKETELLVTSINPIMKFKHTLPGNKIYENRILLFEYAKQSQYELLIMLDIDDMMSPNRVREYRQQYEDKYTFFYNDLYTFDGRKVFKELPEVASLESVLESNYLGLSNTGINIKRLSVDFLKSLLRGNTDVFDWYLYTRILLEKYEGKKVNYATTKYRVYEENIAGIEQSIKQELKVKEKHYKLLSDYDAKYQELLKLCNTAIREASVLTTNQNKKGYWWENIRLINK